MKKKIGAICILAGMFLAVAASWDDGQSYCVLFPQNGRDIFGVTQRNILIFRENEVALIPQVQFEGNARDFGIVVPVPALPRLAKAGANVMNEASFMTQPITRRSSGGCGCDDNDTMRSFMVERAQFSDDAMVESGANGVTVVYEQMVGAYQATVLQANDAVDLTNWLSDNNYRYKQSDAVLFQDYVARNWFFVTMKLDTTQVPAYVQDWWFATTAPAQITFDHSGESLTYPLKISSISVKDRAQVLIYTIADDPMRFPGAKVEYANAVDEDEADAISERYPQLAKLIAPGSFVTKLRRTFSPSEMKSDMQITRSDDRREFRDIIYVNGNGFGFAAVGLLAIGVLLRRKEKK